MQLYSVKPTEVDKLAFGSEKHNLAKIAHQEGYYSFLCIGALNSLGSGIWRVVGLDVLKDPFSNQAHPWHERKKTNTNSRKENRSEKSMEMILSNQVDSTFPCGLSFNCGGEAWGPMACISFFSIPHEQPNEPGSAP